MKILFSVFLMSLICSAGFALTQHSDALHKDPAWVNIVTYGASTTATADSNSTAIEKAFTIGSAVLIPEGDFSFSRSINLPPNGTIRGVGRNSVIRYTGTGAAILASGSKDTHYGMSVSDLTIQNSNTSATSDKYGIKIVGSIKSSFRNLSIIGPIAPTSTQYGTGILIQGGGWGCTFDNLLIQNWETCFRSLDGPAGYGGDYTVCGGTWVGESQFGFLIESVSGTTGNIVIRDSTVDACASAGIRVDSGNNVLLDSIWFETNGAGYPATTTRSTFGEDIRIGYPGVTGPIVVNINNCKLSDGLSPVHLRIHKVIGLNVTGCRINDAAAATYAIRIQQYDLPDYLQNIKFTNNQMDGPSLFDPVELASWTNIFYDGVGFTPSWIGASGTYNVASYPLLADTAARQPVQYRKVHYDADGIYEAQLRGTLTRGSLPDGAVMFTLPAKYRPVSRLDLHGFGGSYYILPTGEVCSASGTYDFSDLGFDARFTTESTW